MLTEYRGVYEFPTGSGPGTIRYELNEDNDLLPVEQTPKAPGEIIDYRVECDCGETFWTWRDAQEHVETEHIDKTVGLPGEN